MNPLRDTVLQQGHSHNKPLTHSLEPEERHGDVLGFHFHWSLRLVFDGLRGPDETPEVHRGKCVQLGPGEFCL